MRYLVYIRYLWAIPLPTGHAMLINQYLNRVKTTHF
jgi:hypothetical protein